MHANDGFELEKGEKEATKPNEDSGACNTNGSGDLSGTHFQNVDLNDEVGHENDGKECARSKELAK